MSKKIIFGSSTPRSGGSLVTNILSLHPEVIITKDFIHFFRYIYKKYNPLTKKNLYKLVYEFCLRIKYRNKIIISPKEILNNINLTNNMNNDDYSMVGSQGDDGRAQNCYSPSTSEYEAMTALTSNQNAVDVALNCSAVLGDLA